MGTDLLYTLHIRATEFETSHNYTEQWVKLYFYVLENFRYSERAYKGARLFLTQSRTFLNLLLLPDTLTVTFTQIYQLVIYLILPIIC
jgi:hypothetical protein